MSEPDPAARPLLEVRAAGRQFRSRGASVAAVGPLSFDVWPGEFVTMVGPSGCGKTTLIRLLAGLLEPTGGSIRFEGRDMTGPPPTMLLLFQQYEKSLLPWRSVYRNVSFALENQSLGKSERAQRIEEALEAVGLTEAARRYPHQLSGGMQQRLAIARALARRPHVLLMDEPFSSLDALTRADLQDLTLRLWHERGQTIVFVTHDVDEAVYLGSRVLVLSPRPATLRDDVMVPLGPIRDQALTREAPTFLRERRYIYDLIRNETEVRDDARDTVLPA